MTPHEIVIKFNSASHGLNLAVARLIETGEEIAAGALLEAIERLHPIFEHAENALNQKVGKRNVNRSRTKRK